MKETEKLYYADSMMTEFGAEVISCAPKGENFELVLDRTAFFPEGGGQYADRGYIGGSKVLDVHEKEGLIYHLVDKPAKEGSHVAGHVDRALRLDRMQQHTGEHIVSGLMHAQFGCDNVGFHLGEAYSTLDFNIVITHEELGQIERRANEAVAEDIGVEVIYPSREALSSFEYRSKKEISGQVRLVKIPGYDICACCAPHLYSTGRIGIIKLTGMQHYKGGVRMTMLCGFRALDDYRDKEAQVKAISAMLCAKEDEAAKAVAHLKEEAANLKAELISAQRGLIAAMAKEEASKPGNFPCLFAEGLKGDGIRFLMNEVLSYGKAGCAVFLKTGADGYRYVIGSASSDVRPLAEALNAAFKGKGGGKKEMVQGSLKGREEEIRKFVCKKAGMNHA